MLRPPALLQLRRDHEQGRVSADELREATDTAVLDALDLQREAGIAVFTDGEQRRANWLAGVMETVGGLVPSESSVTNRVTWHRTAADDGDSVPPTEETDLPEVVVGEKVYRKQDLSLAEADFMLKHAPGQFKITMASSTMGFLFWGEGVTNQAYSSPLEMSEDFLKLQIQDVHTLLDAGVTWIQLDSLTYIHAIDEEFIGAARFSQAELDARIAASVAADNAVIRAARERNPEVTVGVHICRGNNRSAWTARGSYEPVAERLFGEVETDRYLLEYDTERAGGFEPLRFVPPGKLVVLGLVSTKTPVLESSDDLCRRIDAAAKYVPLEQLALGTQCGFASTSGGNLLTMDDERRKLELVATTAERVWGSTQ